MESFTTRLPEILETESITTTDIKGLNLYGCNGISLGSYSSWGGLKDLLIDEYSEVPDNALLRQISDIGLTYNKLKTLVLDSVTSIGINGFLFNTSTYNSCTSLESVSFAKLVTISGTYCLFNCPALTSVTCPLLETVSGYGCLAGTALTSVTFDMLKTVSGDGCLSFCYALESVTFHSLTKVEADWFLSSCRALRNLCFKQEITTWRSGAFGGNLDTTRADTTQIALHLHPNEYDKNVTTKPDGTKWWRGFQWLSIDTNIQ
jgi:hypothetical protein